MSDAVMIRIRHPEGLSTLSTLTSSSTIKELKEEISKLIKAKPNELVLRAGYPPVLVNHSDSTHLSDAEISSGETVIVEVHPQEEPQIQPKPKVEPQVEQKPAVQKIDPRLNSNRDNAMAIEKPAVQQQSSKYPSKSREIEDYQPASYNTNAGRSEYVSKAVENTTTTRSKGPASNPSAGGIRGIDKNYSQDLYKPSGMIDKKASLDELASKCTKDKDAGPYRPVNATKKIEPTSRYETRASTNTTNSGPKDPFYEIKNENKEKEGFKRLKKLSEEPNQSAGNYNDYMQNMTPEDLDAQYARALQESMDVETLGPEKTKIGDLQTNKTNANRLPNTRSTATAGESVTLPKKPSISGTRKTTGSKKTDVDFDEEFARGLQNDEYAGNDEFVAPRPQRVTRNRARPEYDAPDFYDVTKQYNEENNLPEDPPLNNDHLLDSTNEFAGGFARNPYDMGGFAGGNGGFGNDADEQLQRAIQASLGGDAGGGANRMNDTFNDEDFKRIMEQSKYEK